MPTRIFAITALALSLCGPLWGRREEMALREVSIDLPGAPAVVVPADVDGDGLSDLVVVIAYTEWSQIVTEESVEMDQVEGLVEMMTIVPALADRRELHLYRGLESGGFEPFGAPLELDLSILSVMRGPDGIPIVALTDDGLSRLEILRGEEGDALRFEPILERRSVLSYTGTLLPQLDLFFDLDHDGRLDLLFPTRDGFDVLIAGSDGFVDGPDVPVDDLSQAPSTLTVQLPDLELDRPTRLSGQSRHYPLPIVADIDAEPGGLAHVQDRGHQLAGAGAAVAAVSHGFRLHLLHQLRHLARRHAHHGVAVGVEAERADHG